MEVRVLRVDDLDPVFSHQNGYRRIVDQVTSKVGKLAEYFVGDRGVSPSGKQH